MKQIFKMYSVVFCQAYGAGFHQNKLRAINAELICTDYNFCNLILLWKSTTKQFNYEEFPDYRILDCRAFNSPLFTMLNITQSIHS